MTRTSNLEIFTHRRALVLAAAIGALTVLAAIPAHGDSFTSGNVAPTVTSLNSTTNTWTPRSTVTLTWTTGDANTMSGGTVQVCAMRGNDSSVCTAGNAYGKALWTITGSGTTADAGNGTWSLTVNNTPDWTQTSINWNATLTIGDIAGAAGDWYWDVKVTDAASSSAHATYGTPATVPTFTTLTAPSARNFGTVNPGATTANVNQTLTGIKSNTAWSVNLYTTSTWANGGTTISRVSAAPGANQFALRCSGNATIPGAAYIGTSTANVDQDSGFSAFTTDAASTKPLSCAVDTGNTPAGTYTGTVTTEIGTP